MVHPGREQSQPPPFSASQRSKVGLVETEEGDSAQDGGLEHRADLGCRPTVFDAADQRRARSHSLGQLSGGPAQLAARGGDLCAKDRQRVEGLR